MSLRMVLGMEGVACRLKEGECPTRPPTEAAFRVTHLSIQTTWCPLPIDLTFTFFG